MSEKDLKRFEMMRRLHDIKYWFEVNQDTLSCPICGVMVYRKAKVIHEEWHERNNQ